MINNYKNDILNLYYWIQVKHFEKYTDETCIIQNRNNFQKNKSKNINNQYWSLVINRIFFDADKKYFVFGEIQFVFVDKEKIAFEYTGWYSSAYWIFSGFVTWQLFESRQVKTKKNLKIQTWKILILTCCCLIISLCRSVWNLFRSV